MTRRVSRREFIGFTAGSVAGLTLAAPFGAALAQDSNRSTHRTDPGRIVSVAHSGAMSNATHINSDPVAEVVEVMVDTALMTFTELGDVADAWREFIHPDDRVLIKLDCFGAPNIATNEAVVHAVVRGLLSAGVLGDNMVVFDQYQSRMARGHFRVGHSILGATVECAETRGFQTDPTSHVSGLARFAVALANATAIVNLPVIKDHDTCGVAISLRNVTHGMIQPSAISPEDDCRPSVVDLFDTDMVRSKTRVCIADGLRVMYDGGPADGPNKVIRNELFIGTDPVAIDTIGLDMIDQLRVEQGLPSLEADGRGCGWLATAQERGLGVHDRNRITLESHRLA